MWHCGTGAEGFCHTHRPKGYGGGRACGIVGQGPRGFAIPTDLRGMEGAGHVAF